MAYSGRQAPVVAPDKGSFPLDHEGECKPKMYELMTCLKENNGESFSCRQLSRAYLECRMQKGLMAQESLDGLGFDPNLKAPQPTPSTENAAAPKERKGFVSGLEVKPLPKQ